MTTVQVISGIAGKGFTIEKLTVEELMNQIEGVSELDVDGVFSMEDGEAVFTNAENAPSLKVEELSPSDLEKLLSLLSEHGEISLKISYHCHGFSDGEGNQFPILPDEEDTSSFNDFQTDTMQLVQLMEQDKEGNYVYDKNEVHHIFEGVTTVFFAVSHDDGREEYLNLPKALLESYLKHIKVVKG